jgi:hypothetical protein
LLQAEPETSLLLNNIIGIKLQNIFIISGIENMAEGNYKSGAILINA